MVFSSIPLYLDPSNWHQQQNHHQAIGSGVGNPLLPPPPQHGAGSIRPGSMAERARMSNIPFPNPALKCPRCDSPNTKFCYFNNYSLSQPRYFCKACRRYWTNGGTLRNVPVGGGCRRNKRKSSKSPASGDRQTTTTATATTSAANDQNYFNNILGLPPPRFLSPIPQFTDSFAGDHHMGYGAISATASAEINLPGNFLGGSQIMMSDGGGNIEPWRLQPQFPFVGGMDGTYQFQGESSNTLMGVGQRPKFSSRGESIKMEERPHQELNLSRQLLGGLLPAGNESNDNNNSNAANWSGLASFSCSSTSNAL